VVALFVHWQLKQRQLASKLVTACDRLSYKWLTTPPPRADGFQLTSYASKGKWPKVIVDELNVCYKRSDEQVHKGFMETQISAILIYSVLGGALLSVVAQFGWLSWLGTTLQRVLS
jgi:hypothetical protein